MSTARLELGVTDQVEFTVRVLDANLPIRTAPFLSEGVSLVDFLYQARSHQSSRHYIPTRLQLNYLAVLNVHLFPPDDDLRICRVGEFHFIRDNHL